MHQRGFTLVELLISIALGAVLSGAAITLYVESKVSYMQDEELARLQENARFTLDFLKRELSLNGFLGGAKDTSGLAASAITTDCGNGANWALDTSNSFELLNNTDGATALVNLNGTTWNCITASELVAGTDVFSVKRTADRPTVNNGSLVPGTVEDFNQWYFKRFDFNEYSWSYLTSAIPSGEKTAGSTYDYWEYYAKIFFIREYADVSTDGIPTLCQSTLIADAMTTQCLIEGIEDIQIEVGLDADNDNVIERYKDAPTAADFEDVKSVRVYILARSVNEVPGYTNTKTYRLGQKNIAAFNDGYIRKVFTTTIKMRNVKLG